MSDNRISALRQAQHAILNLVASCTGCAIALYESTSDGGVTEILCSRQFESYCSRIQSVPEGGRLCRDDHIRRAKQVTENGIGGLTLCHAGVFNQALPIVVDGKVRAVLMYGQIWIDGDRQCAEARNRHENVIAHLKPAEEDELELRVGYDDIKRLSRRDLKLLNEQLSLLQRFFYGMLTERLELDRYTENVIHDLQTRLQPILAQAQKLSQVLGRITDENVSVDALAVTANDLLQSTLAMRVPIWNLGNFMPHYQFGFCPLKILMDEAIVLYGAEADRKGVDIQAELQEPSSILMSRTHLQQAINNLLHNAIKYSFYGRYDLDRFVEIVGEIDGLDYILIFSNYGVGILPEEFDLIFQCGYKGKLTYEEYRSGAGRGLAITKEVIDNHNGTIEVESRKTGGDAYVNKFIVRLPRTRSIVRSEEGKK